MDSLFVALLGASLFITWTSGERIAELKSRCNAGDRYAETALQNAKSLSIARLAPFGRAEKGWETYAPQISVTVGTTCAPHTARFAEAVALWQARHELEASGAVDEATLAALKLRWQQARPFIARFEPGDCPPPVANQRLADIAPSEGWLGKAGQLDMDALASFRRMVAAARAADPRIAIDPDALTIVSAYRSPAYDAARCNGGRCNGIAKARCSAHRTGTAVDLFVGAAPGHGPVDSDNANRLYLSRTPAYRWLVANGRHYGFVNYVFEPWHWEFVGVTGRQVP
jgi:hypothetical protein